MESKKEALKDGWNMLKRILDNGMFTTVFNWCRISQPSTVWFGPGKVKNGDSTLFDGGRWLNMVGYRKKSGFI